MSSTRIAIYRDDEVKKKLNDDETNVLWRTASDTDLLTAGQTVRFDSPVLKNASETRKVNCPDK